MREGTDLDKVRAFMVEIGRSSTGSGKVYLVGGATALLLGIRSQTIDIDIKLEPEPPGVFEAIQRIKEKLSVNVEVASPDQFLPELSGWESRSEYIGREGEVEFFHYDFYAQALAKISRNFTRDLADVKALVSLGKISMPELRDYFEGIQERLIRFPAIDRNDFRSKFEKFLQEVDSNS